MSRIGQIRLVTISLVCVVTSRAVDAVVQQVEDPTYDVLPRPTDLSGTVPFDLSTHRAPNIISITIGQWEPNEPIHSVFEGEYSDDGDFMRIDLVLEGLINPPGCIDPQTFEPFRYGPNPVFGFIELDVDNDVNTGGETEAPEFRYTANATRFGGLPADGPLSGRLATKGSEIDGNFNTAPFIERQGEEYHWALLGCEFIDNDISVIIGNSDLIFEHGEEWLIVGDWFHRAHGFEPFSLVFGRVIPGEYLPYSIARFHHDLASNTTMVSLAAPLDNDAAADLLGTFSEPNDSDASNLTSVEEGLEDLIFSAGLVKLFPTGDPTEVLITGWDARDASDYTEPDDWRLTALLGTSYTSPGGFFVWTDIYPNVDRGEIDNNGADTESDFNQIQNYINAFDLLDGQHDGAVTLSNFAENFDLFDISYDGVVDQLDVLLAYPIGDVDTDDDVDMHDFYEFQKCPGVIAGSQVCTLSDINGNSVTDSDDYLWMLAAFSGALDYD